MVYMYSASKVVIIKEFFFFPETLCLGVTLFLEDSQKESP